jgi:hypothetical protein
MIAPEFLLAEDLTEFYLTSPKDQDFEGVLQRFPVDTDAQLADLIEADGRVRLRLKRLVTLNRYLDAVPDLAERLDPLDAAVDMALRALARTGTADEASVERLVEQFPQLGPAIRDAAALSNALWSTRRVRKHLAHTPLKELPCDFGPPMEGGQRRYEFRELLGEGAFGQVYLAIDRQLGEKDHPALVSIKLLPGQERSPWSQQHLIDEAAKARRINHPNVVRVLDRGVSDQDEDYLVYEYVEGGDLARWARRRGDGLSVNQAARTVAKIARGVHAAHMVGLVHCDLKPNNIVLTADGEVKVADFGVAIRADEQEGPPGQDGAAAPLGNLAFISPEQFRMEPGALTIPTDIYALGGILYWLLTGVLPNGSTPETIRRTHDLVKGRPAPPSVRAKRPEVDRDLEAICHRALAPRPEGRYGSAAELASNLEAWLRREPVSWTRPSVLRRLHLWARRKPAVAVATGLILALAVASGAALRHLASVAQQKRFEALIAQAELEKEEEMRHASRGKIRKFISRLDRLQSEGLAHEVLPQIWLTEWLFGPDLFGEGPERLDLWEIRTEVVRDLIEKSSDRGGDRSFLTLMWQSALGFWLVHDGHYREAEPLVADNCASWRAILDPADPWLLHLRGLQACAAVGRIAGAGDYSETPSAAGEDLDALAAALESAEELLSEDEHGSPLHYVVLVHQELLYRPDLLDRPRQRAEAQETLRMVTE